MPIVIYTMDKVHTETLRNGVCEGKEIPSARHYPHCRAPTEHIFGMTTVFHDSDNLLRVPTGKTDGPPHTNHSLFTILSILFLRSQCPQRETATLQHTGRLPPPATSGIRPTLRPEQAPLPGFRSGSHYARNPIRIFGPRRDHDPDASGKFELSDLYLVEWSVGIIVLFLTIQI